MFLYCWGFAKYMHSHKQSLSQNVRIFTRAFSRQRSDCLVQVNLDKMLNSRTQDGSLTHNRWIFISFLVDISSPLQSCIFPALLASYPNWMRIASPAARGAGRRAGRREADKKHHVFERTSKQTSPPPSKSLSLALSLSLSLISPPVEHRSSFANAKLSATLPPSAPVHFLPPLTFPPPSMTIGRHARLRTLAQLAAIDMGCCPQPKSLQVFRLAAFSVSNRVLSV